MGRRLFDLKILTIDLRKSVSVRKVCFLPPGQRRVAGDTRSRTELQCGERVPPGAPAVPSPDTGQAPTQQPLGPHHAPRAGVSVRAL